MAMSPDTVPASPFAPFPATLSHLLAGETVDDDDGGDDALLPGISAAHSDLKARFLVFQILSAAAEAHGRGALLGVTSSASIEVNQGRRLVWVIQVAR
jgi:hypothetical protein